MTRRPRNVLMAERIARAPVRHPFSFVVVGHRHRRGADRNFHAVEISVAEDGSIAGRVLQAFDPVDGHARLRFGGAGAP